MMPMQRYSRPFTTSSSPLLLLLGEVVASPGEYLAQNGLPALTPVSSRVLTLVFVAAG